MAENRRQAKLAAKRDLDDKLLLEDRLRVELRNLGTAATRRFTRLLGTSGRVAPVGDDVAALVERILRDHYDRVAGVFSFRLTDQMPGQVAVTEEERAEIDRRLGEAFDLHAKKSADYIGDTTQSDAEFALNVARGEGVKNQLSPLEVATIAGAGFARKFRGRESIRVISETQWAAEVSKQIEAEVLIGEEVFEEKVASGKKRGPIAIKEWVSQGDDLVRDWHLVADGKQVYVTKPYTVAGEKLMFPRDTSLGATNMNVQGCRCASVVDPAPVIISREMRGIRVGGPTPAETTQTGGLTKPGETPTLELEVPKRMPRGKKPMTSKEIIFTDGSTPEFRSAISQIVNDQPKNIQRAIGAKGIRFHGGRLLTDIRPELKGVQPRGWPSGSTWDGAEGAFNGMNNMIMTTEGNLSKLGRGKTFIKAGPNRLKYVANHEIGHAIDWTGTKGVRFSWTPEFRAAHAQAMKRIKEPEWKSFKRDTGYFQQAGDAGAEETFAEIYSIIQTGTWHGSGLNAADFRTVFKEAFDIVEKIVTPPGG